MKHSELGDTYLTLLEAVKQTGLSEAEVVLHSEEVWIICPRTPKNEQLGKGTEADVVSNWIGMSEVSGKTEMPVCAKLTDETKCIYLQRPCWGVLKCVIVLIVTMHYLNRSD